MLYDFISTNRAEIIRRCRTTVAARSVPAPTAAEIEHGIPLFLDQLADALRLGLSSPEIGRSAHHHGQELRLQGFTVSQVVYDYGNVCQAITGLAGELNAPIANDEFRVLNRCLDDAIAGAVTEFGRGSDQATLEAESARGSERLGFFAHELRNLIDTSILAFAVLKTGNVGVGGSTGTVLYRNLTALRTLVIRSLAEVRTAEGGRKPERFQMSRFIDDVAPGAVLDANDRGIRLDVLPVEDDVVIEADRQILTAAVGNLLQNAFKFTRPRTTVTLRVGAGAERVLIEIEDECGGLPVADPNDLFRPFEQQGDDRTGLGLGLAFTRQVVEASNGRIYARNLPGKGCVFAVDLPRCPSFDVVAT